MSRQVGGEETGGSLLHSQFKTEKIRGQQSSSVYEELESDVALMLEET